jgi:hypothetical protein
MSAAHPRPSAPIVPLTEAHRIDERAGMATPGAFGIPDRTEVPLAVIEDHRG